MEVLTSSYLSTIPFLNSSISFPSQFSQNTYNMAYGSRSLPWNEGEKEMTKIMHVSGQGNPNSPFLSPGAGYMIQGAPLLALGTLDDQDRPWTTIWGGDPGFGRPVAKNVVGVKTVVDRRFDPVVETLLGGADEGEIVKAEGEGRMVGGLTIDLESRMRVKLHGHMIAGAMEGNGDGEKSVGKMQLVVSINKSVGNCPKYLNSKRIIPFTPEPKLISDSPQLPPEALALLDKADMFFMSSSDGSEDVDTNHRGGPAGFVRVISNEESGAVIVYPEYSGNRMYETLGNLKMNPLAGITVPNFDTGDVLYLTGQTEILIGKEASSVLLRSNLAVKLTITAGALRAERSHIQRHPRGTFSVQSTYYLDQGYSHMRDEDPQSLNDDLCGHLRCRVLLQPQARHQTMSSNSPSENNNWPNYEADSRFRSKVLAANSASRRRKLVAIIPVIAVVLVSHPFLGQVNSIDVKQLRLLWAIRTEDIGLSDDGTEFLREVAELESGLRGGGYWKMSGICALGPRLKSAVLNWLAGRRVIYEDFGY
ncbi:hypothetical protein BKA64DRAFT_689894 [Cadophora sp. MPI-SDFR-AT-0126]|nr:hypothetical protein BKA64DRAFT_689894 [Leotiomycetes sp. MPI-SDFR-AT-0126]